MRRARGTLVVLATVALSLLAAGLAGSSAAGGPTTIVLTVPGGSRSASVTMGTSEYDQLASLVGADETARGSTTRPPGVDESRPPGSTDPAGPTVTLSWLSHDVMVWRLDRVYLNAEGGPWISTQTYGDSADPWAEPTRWHSAPANGKELGLMLDRLGVGLNQTATPLAAAPATAAATALAASVAPQGVERTAGSSEPAGPLGVLLAVLLGVLLGVGLTLAAGRWRAAAASNRPRSEALSSPAAGT